ncbi:hypothetical protein GOV10_04440 [Candidatus Woesearchaeota archaeon]|nr:hypothetical protein [Candidatus Woesearchaeota archaeon]
MKFRALDKKISCWMERYGHRILRYSLGLVFIWFGALKLIPGLSPAQELVELTVPIGAWFVILLGVWEIVIGLCLWWRPALRVGIGLMALQMMGTFLPLIFLSGLSWQSFGVPTLEGQYIIKNVVLIGAAIVIGGTVGHKHKGELD